ncbi:hypothetical protein DB88DRAFT_440618 [Papiliotrema laurentii]|uniref:Uncharacterized protein n=1 Tax=Papiliotrema laurentii TaxID=5418 RepID=A0AAD9CVP5_PAPLA|nr:hypothetical protein DB88DRAFT_440618 [Papiliotrema laurentii]
MPLGSYPQPTRVVQHLYDKAAEWLERSYPIRDYPLNIRPGMLFVTAAWLILLGILGMAPLPELPVNDKALHFLGMGFATFLLYFTIEVPEGPARRVWYIRRAPLLLASAFGFWKQFQWGDILANLVGSALFLYAAHLLHLRFRKRAELSSLYQPLSIHNSSTYRDAQGRQHAFDAGQPLPETPDRGPTRHARSGSNVWEADSDARTSIEDGRAGQTMFDIGDDEDDHPHQPGTTRTESAQLV